MTNGGWRGITRMNGGAVMYDNGKILVVGGALSYSGVRILHTTNSCSEPFSS